MGVPFALISAAGAFVGAITYGYGEKKLRALTSHKALPHGKKGDAATLDQRIQKHPIFVALALGSLLGSFPQAGQLALRFNFLTSIDLFSAYCVCVGEVQQLS